MPQNQAAHRWLAEDILTDGPIQNIAYYLNLLGLGGAQLNVANTFTQPQTLPVIDKGGQVWNVKAYGAKGDGVTDDSVAIRAAITAASVSIGASGAGTVYFPQGEYVINSADVNNNGLTITAKGLTLQGEGNSAGAGTVITIAQTGLIWGIAAKAQGVALKDLYIQVTATTAPYWVTGVVGGTSISREGCQFENIYIQYQTTAIPSIPGGTSTQPAAGIAFAPDTPGSTSADISNCIALRCSVNGPATIANPLSAFQVGNGTQGNTEQNTHIDCWATSVTYGIHLAGSGARWYGGGFFGCRTADIAIPLGGFEPASFTGVNGQNGNQALLITGGGPVYGGILLEQCVFSGYSQAGGGVISCNLQGNVTMIACVFSTGTGAAFFTVNGTSHCIFTAINVAADSGLGVSPYPAASATLQRVILGASVYSAGFDVPLVGYQLLIDGTATIGGAVITASPNTLAITAINATAINASTSLTTQNWYVSTGGDVADVGTGNPILGFIVGSASAVNWIKLASAATTVAPTFSAFGTDTNIDIAYAPKGSGAVSSTGGFKTLAITSGALSTTTFVSGTGKQILTTRDVTLVVPITYNPGAATTATCAVALSPDNTTYTTVTTDTVPVGVVLDGTIRAVTVTVPAGWYAKLTVNAQATIGTGTYY